MRSNEPTFRVRLKAARPRLGRSKSSSSAIFPVQAVQKSKTTFENIVYLNYFWNATYHDLFCVFAGLAHPRCVDRQHSEFILAAYNMK